MLNSGLPSTQELIDKTRQRVVHLSDLISAPAIHSFQEFRGQGLVFGNLVSATGIIISQIINRGLGFQV